MRGVRVRWWLVVAATAVGCASEPAAPEVYYVAPEQVAVGAELQLVGAKLCGERARVAEGQCVEPPAATVNFGAEAQVVRGNTLVWRDDRISLIVPFEVTPGARTLTVSIDGVVTAPVELTVIE